MSVHFHSNRCTNTPPATGRPEINGAAPAWPALLASAPALPALLLAPPLPPAPPVPPTPAPAPAVFMLALPWTGGASEPVPHAPSAPTRPNDKPRNSEFVFTRFDVTLLAVHDFVKANHGKTAHFTVRERPAQQRSAGREPGAGAQGNAAARACGVCAPRSAVPSEMIGMSARAKRHALAHATAFRCAPKGVAAQ